jgi:hypothetical protein
VHRAAGRVQQCIRRYAWYCQIDISNYFANIDHEILLAVLLRRFKGDEFSQQLQRLLDSYHHEPGKGLPIGSLTSQYFANYYLDGLDRLLDGLPQVRAHVRYMDDVVWWGDGKQQVKQVLQQVQAYLHGERQLHIKPAWKIQYSTHGISYCGYRILPGAVRLSVRRKRRYQQRRLYWERQYQRGHITANQLQTAYAAVHSILQGTNSSAWLRQNLHHHPPIPL